jgi:hypothetical protein
MRPHHTFPGGFIDAGWLYILAGLAVCGVALLVPAQQDLEVVTIQRDQLQAHSLASTRRIAAYDSVLQGLQQQDPVVMKRLASSQLNLLAEGETPILLDASVGTGTVDAWVEKTTWQDPAPPPLARDTVLASLSGGPYRTLLIASGIFCVFLGLLLPGYGEKSPA